MQSKIIFVHGFGVRKDARGMFTEIAKAFPNFESIFTDLNKVLENGDTYLNPLHKQAEIIKEVYEKEKNNSKIFVIAHSQGCVVASLAMLPQIEKIFFLAPPTNNDLDKTINAFKNREGTIIDFEGVSVLARRDGTKTFVPKEYWEERKNIEYMEEYKKCAERNSLITIIARQDDVVTNESKDLLEKICKVVEIDGDHNFDENRVELIEVIKNNL